jgi:NADH-quinone oxidoreductase subunit I
MNYPGKGIVSSLLITLKHIFRPKITLRYPLRKQAMSERFFGLMVLTTDEHGVEKCTACGICANNCPTHCITMTKGKREDGKPFAQEYHINIQQCMFCGICVEVCPFDALHVGHRYELSTYNRESLDYGKNDLLVGFGGDR